MEKIRVGINEFDLVPAQVSESPTERSFRVYASSYNEVDLAFSNVLKITHIQEDEREITYLDCVKTTSILDHKDGTYTVFISRDETGRKISYIEESTEVIETTIDIILTMVIPSLII